MPINGIEFELCLLHFWTGSVTRRLATEIRVLSMSDRTMSFGWVPKQMDQAKVDQHTICRPKEIIVVSKS